MNIVFRATEDFMARVRKDLVRAHLHASERVGFISVRAATGRDGLVLLAENYYPVADADYEYAPDIGALIGQEGLRKALEIALLNPVGMVHVHMHLLPGRLWFSRTDLREQVKFVPDFFKVRANMPHGAIVLSPYSAAGRIWLGPDRVENITEFNVVGTQVRITRAHHDGSTDFYV